MSEVQQRIQQVRRRLNLNHFFAALGIGVLVAATGWMLIVLIERLFQFGIQLEVGIGVAAVSAMLIALTMTYIRRADDHVAAVTIDQAAGLKERVSSALAFSQSGDPFARATCDDAVKVVRSVHVPQHVPLQAPRSWPWTFGMIASAAILYGVLPQFNLLAVADVEDREDPTRRIAERKEIEVAVKDAQRRLADKVKDNPQLKNLVGNLDELELDDASLSPDELRRDVVKKVESVSNSIRKQLNSDEMKLLEALKRDLAKLETREGDDKASKLAEALQQGDMKAAKAAMGELKKELQEAAENKELSAEQKSKLKAMEQKLSELSKQVEQLADNKRMQKELENKAGLSAEQAKQILDQMKNMDPKDMQKALEQALQQQGVKMDADQMKKLAEKMAQDQQLKQKMQDMAQAMQQAAQAAGQQGEKGQQGEGQAGAQGMQGAMDMMSDLEMAEQMMNDLEGQLSDLEDLKAGVGNCDNPGPGREPGDQIGGQGPQAGLGYGATTGKKTAAHGYKTQRVKGKVKGGEIIGQMLVDGPQLKGEVGVEAQDALAAAQRDATEAIDRKEIPRQYWKVVREFTESMAGLSPPAEAPAGDGESGEE